MKKLLVSLSILIFSGCATSLTDQAQRILQVTDNEVKNCKMLGEVHGASSYGGLMMQEAGKQYAKNEALNQASNMQATHVVWTNAEGGFMGGKALGRAYKCR